MTAGSVRIINPPAKVPSVVGMKFGQLIRGQRYGDKNRPQSGGINVTPFKGLVGDKVVTSEKTDLTLTLDKLETRDNITL